jgi:hypothetical protein
MQPGLTDTFMYPKSKPARRSPTAEIEAISSRLIASRINLAYLPIVERLRTLRESRSKPVACVFASLHPRAGTTHITRELGRQLALQTGKRVETPSAADIWHAESPQHVSHMVNTVTDPKPQSRASQVMESFRSHYDYMLIDCPPLSISSECLVFGRCSDGLCLVIEAGRTRRSDLQAALTRITMCNIPVFGLVLNKRTYPIPKLIYRLL